jgi:hypothetical protein
MRIVKDRVEIHQRISIVDVRQDHILFNLTMKLYIITLLSFIHSTLAYTVPSPRSVTPTDAAVSSSSAASSMSRRHVFAGLMTAIVGSQVVVGAGSPLPAQAAEPISASESVYFGVGCFWHIQHEFVVAERELLGRSDRELTSLTGYAGGKSTDSFQRVCYHNFQQVADYGKMGHGEVVGMQLPSDKIVDFASVYFSLFNPKTLGTYTPMKVSDRAKHSS